jgi:ABC-type phosphate transport system permease subunit
MPRSCEVEPAQGVACEPEPRSPQERKEVIVMSVTIPLIVIVALVVFLAYRFMGLRAWHAVVSLILGFLLAATSAAPEISGVLAAIVQWLHKP